MFILGHIGITAFLASLLFFYPFLAAISSQIPDLIDKPLYLLGIFPSGRYIGHTILAVLVIGLLAYALTKRKLVALSISFGMLMHLFEDLPYFIPWFYPFINYNFPTDPFEFHYTFKLFILDVTGLILLIILYNKNKTFKGEILGWKEIIQNILKKFKINNQKNKN